MWSQTGKSWLKICTAVYSQCDTKSIDQNRNRILKKCLYETHVKIRECCTAAEMICTNYQ